MILLFMETDYDGLILGILPEPGGEQSDMHLLQNPFSHVHEEDGRKMGQSWHKDMLI